MVRMSVFWLCLMGMGLSAFAAFGEEVSQTVVILLGAPGSGKGTQAVRVSEELGIPHISTGDLFRDNIERRTELGKRAQADVEAGRLASDELVTEMLFERVGRPDCAKGYVLDGVPRRLSQAELLNERLADGVKVIVLNLEVSDAVVTERLLGRKRSDDTPEVIKERLKIYHAETKPVIDFYRRKGVLIEIDGEKGPDEVFAQMKRALN